MFNMLEDPAFVDRFGMIVVGVIFGMIVGRLVLPSSFQRNIRSVVHHPRYWLGL